MHDSGPVCSSKRTFHDTSHRQANHRAGNILDLIFTNNANYIHSFSSNITSMSDHHILECHTVMYDNLQNSSIATQVRLRKTRSYHSMTSISFMKESTGSPSMIPSVKSIGGLPSTGVSPMIWWKPFCQYVWMLWRPLYQGNNTRMAPKLVTLTKFPDIVGNWWELGEE